MAGMNDHECEFDERVVIGKFILERRRIQMIEEQRVRREGEIVKLSGRLWHPAATVDVIRTRAREARRHQPLATDSPAAPRNPSMLKPAAPSATT
jgi:hypothetical protein